MRCVRARPLLDAWIDDELDPATRDEIAMHMVQCPSCAARHAERAELRDTIRGAALRHGAPPAFAAVVRRAVALESSTLALRWRGPTWQQAAVLATAAAFAGALTMSIWLEAPSTDLSREQAVASHVAALAVAEGRPDRLVQVVATDRHVLKPWFQGKVDFAPPVPDLASSGFDLLGARLDRVGDRQAAVVVYRIRNHPIDLFVWRATRDAVEPVGLGVARGFSVATWTQQGLRFAAVSNVDAGDLERFARALSSAP